MIATITLDHKELMRAIELFVRNTYATTVPLDSISVETSGIYADNEIIDKSYSATVTFSMEKVRTLGLGMGKRAAELNKEDKHND